MFCFHELRYAGKQVTRTGKLSFLAQHRFTALVQSISNCGDLYDTLFTLDKVQKVSIYGSLRNM